MALIKPRVQHALADPEKDKKDLVDALEWMQYQLGSCKPLVLYAYQHVYGWELSPADGTEDYIRDSNA